MPVRNHAQAILSMFWTWRWTSWHGDHEIPCDLRARGLHRARVVGIVVAWVRDVTELWQRGSRIGRRKQRFDTDRPIARGSAGRAVLMKQAWQALCRARATLGNGLN